MAAEADVPTATPVIVSAASPNAIIRRLQCTWPPYVSQLLSFISN
jgi:hypothetical protein